jgi:serine phosphatase RsbU (regulator of sigma subunit)
MRPMSFRRISLFIWFCVPVFALKAQPNRYGLPYIQNYHYTETGGGEQNWGITQDRRGVIYVANNDNGILEFDGNSWRSYPVPGNVAVRSVVAGDDGFIYAGLEGDFGRLEPDLRGSLHYKSLLDSIQREAYSEDDFWRTYYNEDKVYSCGRQAIIVFDAARSEIFTIDPPENSTLTFFIGPQMYISNVDAGLIKSVGEEFVPVNGGGYFSGRFISGLVAMDSDHLLVSTFNQRLYLLDTLDGTIDSTFLKPDLMEELVSARMIYMQKPGRDIYIGTREGGLFVLNDRWELKEKFSVNEGLLDNAIPHFIFDPGPGGESALWIAHWKGISRVDIHSPFRSVSVGPGIGDMYGRGRGELITDLEEFGGDLYVSTLGGLLQHHQSRENMRLRPVRGIRGEINDLQVVKPAAGNEFLLAAGDERTFVLDRNMQMAILPSGGRRLLVDRNAPGVLYTGHDQFKAFQYKGGQWEEVLHLDLGTGIMSMCQDRYGLIWIATPTGLIRLKLQGVREPALQYFNAENGLPPGSIEVFAEPGSQELLVGSREGFFRFDYIQEKLLYDSLYNSILPEGRNSIRTIHRGADNLIWVSFENEHGGWNILAARRTDSGFQKVYERSFLTLAPMISADVFYTDPEGQLWFSRANELIHFDKSRAIETRDSIEVLMRNVRIAGDSVLFDGTYFTANSVGELSPILGQTRETQPRIKHHYRDIEFRWSAPYYQNERQIQYTYYLEGFSRDWSEWSPERSVKFTNLPYGKYEMQIKARNVFGDESPVSAYAFSILKPWYATITALLLYFILITSLVIFVIFYTRRLRSRAELLEKQNKEIELQKKKLELLNEEITTQRDEIEAQRDSILGQKELIDRQKNAITDSIQYARRIQDALLPAREVMRYMLPKHFVFYQPKDIVSGDFFWVDKRDEIVHIAVADCTGHGVPGAFMSMLGISLLNEISGKGNVLSTDEIMDELRDQLIAALGQSGEMYEARDGIEMSLVALNTRNREVQFTGANQDIYTFLKGEMVVIKGDRMPVGIHSEGGKPFSAQTFKLNRGDTLYMLTDGYPDQFGGPKRKKYGTLRLKSLLTGLQTSIMHDQKAAVEKEFDTWKGDHEQIDDVLMIGIQV